jgi:hypothetical protein
MEATFESLSKQLEDYESQLAIVEGALSEDPTQFEFQQVKDNLIDVIKITKDLLVLKKETDNQRPTYPDIFEVATARGIFVGMQVEAVWEDGEWYKGTVTHISIEGFQITFSEYGNINTVGPHQVRPRKAHDVVVVDAKQAGAQTFATKNTLVVDKHTGELVLPASLKITPTDSEQVRKMKKKGIKALKSEHRKIVAEEQRNKRKASWQDFQNKGKVNKKAKKDGGSIFQSPDTIEGKVGVVGSGKKMTEFKFQKYEPKKLNSSLPVGVMTKKTQEEDF